MKVWLRTFGCRANHYDAEAVRAMAERGGATIVPTAAEADVAVFTSCAVTADAEADLRQAVRRAQRENPGIRSVVTGCAAALDRGAIAALPGVEHVIAGGDLPAVAAALAIPATAGGTLTQLQSGTRALLRVQDGCDEHCTFCATTLARGAGRSRTVAELVPEARGLARHHPEIVLTGVHVGTWGRDVGSSLGELLVALVEEVPEVRFRLASVEATEVDDRLRALLRALDGRVCPYLHAPLQSGSDRVLRRMGRHWYTAEEYERAIDRLVDGMPYFGLGADVITGFPGEGDDDHERTRRLVERLPFTHLHVFPWSPRPGTAAVRLAGRVAEGVAAERARELRAIGRAKEDAHRRARRGGAADVVALGGGEGRGRRGLTDDYLTVVVPDAVPRGLRFRATLEADAEGRLLARPPGGFVPARAGRASSRRHPPPTDPKR